MKTQRHSTNASPVATLTAKQTSSKGISESSQTPEKKVTQVPKDAVIVAKFNAGWGNNLFIHGEGAGLTWEKGTPMKNINEEFWVWSPDSKGKHGKISFKITINGKTWTQGNNIELKPGQKITLEPKF